MKFLLAQLSLLSLISHSAFAIDTGNGSDGACNVTGGGGATQITSARKTYQCTSLDFDANLDDFSGAQAGAGGAPLVIKVQGNVTVAVGVTIDLSGQSGNAGSLVAAINPGGQAGAGGSSGGSTKASGGSLPTGYDGENGAGSGGGTFGDYVVPFGTSSYGGGGGGGSYKTQGATLPVDGDSVGGGTPPNTAGINGSIFGDEATFDSSFTGGSGGGGGGGCQDSGTLKTGSSGGGGGGAIRIIAGGNITVDGSIIATGGNGGGSVATAFSGGGGGGSGGAIWLQAAGSLTVSNTGVITALGGNFGDNDSNGTIGSGGDGGSGRIRLDDADGVINAIGGSTITPAPYSASFSPTPIVSGTSSVSRQYVSDVSCASVALGDDEKPLNNILNLLLGMGAVALFQFALSRKLKA